MKKVLLGLLLGLLTVWAQAQNRQISGKVTSYEDGSTLPGVNVLVKGSTIGSTTDANGNYTISIPPDTKTLVVSFVGYVTEEVPVGASDQIDVLLVQDIQLLDAVVVTALGIEKEKKVLGYSVQEIEGETLTKARETNVLNSLSGRVAGLQITASGTGTGGSSRVVIRGNNSLRPGANQALFVVDGVPVDNSNNRQAGPFGGIDYGSGISDINPDDIESISVLKGPNAAALYGTRAANGVIIITTKSGAARKGLGISFNSNTTFEKPLVLPDFQNQYGQGVNGTIPVGTDGVAAIPQNIESSWGPRMEGQPVRIWNGEVRPYSPQPDNIADFFQTGRTLTNTLALSGGGEKATVRLSLSNLDNKGILPNSSLQRNTITLKADARITDKLSADVKVNYINQRTFNRPNLSDNPDNIMYGFYYMPRSIDLNDLRTYQDANGNPVTWAATGRDAVSGYLVSRRQNPFWTTNLNTNEDTRDRIIGYASLKYQFTDWLSLQVRTGTDFYTQRIEERTATRTLFESSSDRGKYVLTTFNVMETNTDFLLAASRKLNENFSASLNLGGNLLRQKREEVGNQTSGLNIPNLFTIANGAAPIALYGITKKEIQSLYAFGQLAYKDYLFLDLTGRNDWASTLPKQNWSFFYPSASTSFVFTDALQLDSRGLSFGKVRASWAQVGNDADAYSLTTTYANGIPHAGQGTATIRPAIPLATLKPEITTSLELGTDIRFFNNRLGLDVAWYRKNTINQVLNISIPTVSGFSSKIINAGNVQNAGIEAIVNGTPVKTKQGFEWNVAVNFARNRSKIVALTPELTNYALGTDRGFVSVAATVDRPFGDLRGRTYRRNENGERIIGTDGLPVAGDIGIIGNYLPDWTGGVSNSFKYKNVTLSFLIDVRKGGDILSISQIIASENGNARATLPGRAEWYAGTGGYVAEGVVATTQADGSVTYSPNTQVVNPETYWRKVAAGQNAIAEEFVYDGSFVKFREVSLGYQLPKALLNRTPFAGVNISLVGRNLFFIHKNTPGFDPESSYNNGNAQGIESAAFPSTRSLGFNVNINL